MTRRPRTAITLLMLGLAVTAVSFIGRVVQLQTAPPAELIPFVTAREGVMHTTGLRGEVRDRRGRVLATSRFGWRVFADPTRIPLPFDEHVFPLAEAIGVEPDELGRRLASVVEANQNLPEGKRPRQYLRLSDPVGSTEAVAVDALDLDGIYLERVPVRLYPTQSLTASVVGKVGFEHEGRLGVEHREQHRLAGQDGVLRYVRDHEGRPLWVDPGGLTPTERGDDIWLTLDVEIQRIALEELERGVKDADAAGGRAVVIEPLSGDVLAIADYQVDRDDVESFPWIAEDDWEQRRDEPGPGRRRYDAVPYDARRDIHPAMARNRCVEDIYEPGSTFKPFVWAVALEAGIFQPDAFVETHDGEWRTSYGRWIRDTEPMHRQTWADVLLNSSNIGMVKAGEALSKDTLRSAVTRFGFGRRTGIELPGEAVGIVTPSSRWNDYSHTSVSFGQEVAVTPIQMARAFSTFARPGDLAGTLPGVQLVRDDVQVGRELQRRVLSPTTVTSVREALAGVGDKIDRRMESWGEGPFAYRMFGKSGTADIPLGAAPEGHRRPRWVGGYYDEQYTASFVGAAPASDPRLVVLVVIDDPGPGVIVRRMHYGSSAAAPVVRRIFERALSYQQVPADRPADASSLSG